MGNWNGSCLCGSLGLVRTRVGSRCDDSSISAASSTLSRVSIREGRHPNPPDPGFDPGWSSPQTARSALRSGVVITSNRQIGASIRGGHHPKLPDPGFDPAWSSPQVAGTAADALGKRRFLAIWPCRAGGPTLSIWPIRAAFLPLSYPRVCKGDFYAQDR